MRRWFLVLIAVAAMVMALPGCESLDPGAGASQESETTRLWQEADANAALITGLTGRVVALEAKGATEVSTASFNALQNEVGSLRNTVTTQDAKIAALDARIAELEDGGSGGSSSGGDNNILSETRWRLRPNFFINGDIVTYATRSADPPTLAGNPDDISISMLTSPRTIKIADVYEIVIGITNEGDQDLYVNDVYLELLFEPTDDVVVSEDSGIYQVSTSCNVYWYSEVHSSSRTGICRSIKAETEEFNIRVKPDSTVKLELEFELIYE